MKKIFSIPLVFILLGSFCLKAQHEYYGVTTTGTHTVAPHYWGGRLFKVDSTGHNLGVLADLDSSGGAPIGSVIHATNGKLYGTAQYGGVNGEGYLFEYDPILDTFQIKIDIPYSARYPIMQASNGKIYYASNHADGYLMEYDIITNTLTSIQYLSYNETPTGTLVEVNGSLYGICSMGGGVGNSGRIYKYNLTTHAFNYVHNFNCTTEGCGATGGLIKGNNGLLYGALFYQVANPSTNGGSLYSFNPANNAFVHLINVPDSIGSINFLTLGANNKIYGFGSRGTDVQGSHFGDIF